MSDFRILIADDHPLFRDALKSALADGFDALHIDEAGSFKGVRDTLDADENYDLILLDLKMPGVQGFSGLMYLRAQYSAVPIIVVSASEDAQVIRSSFEFGASGFVPKSAGADSIREALSHVMGGGIWVPPGFDLSGDQDGEGSQLASKLSTLTPQQVRVLMMLSQGLLNKQIAFELTVSEATVKAHVSAILQKLGVDSRTQAVIVANKIDVGQ